MALETTPPDPAPILELLVAFRQSKIMFAAVSLGVFDQLVAGPATLAELAARLPANADALERLLDACVGMRLLSRSGDRYENSPAAAAYLSSSSPRRMTGYINYSNEVMWKLWAHLEDAVSEGTHRWKQTFGWDGPIFSHFFRTEEAKREFLMGMHGFGLISSPHVVAAFDLSGFRTLVDLGGATGHLTVAACRHWPNLRGVVFDLPDAVPMAREYVAAEGLADRIDVVAGDFFTDPLPDGDLFSLGRILHDWTEEKMLKLLRRIVERLPTGGSLLIAEKLLADDRSGPLWAQMQNLNMLTCTEGKERTLAEYREVLMRAGFDEVQGQTTSSPSDALMATRLR